MFCKLLSCSLSWRNTKLHCLCRAA